MFSNPDSEADLEVESYDSDAEFDFDSISSVSDISSTSEMLDRAYAENNTFRSEVRAANIRLAQLEERERQREEREKQIRRELESALEAQRQLEALVLSERTAAVEAEQRRVAVERQIAEERVAREVAERLALERAQELVAAQPRLLELERIEAARRAGEEARQAEMLGQQQLEVQRQEAERQRQAEIARQQEIVAIQNMKDYIFSHGIACGRATGHMYGNFNGISNAEIRSIYSKVCQEVADMERRAKAHAASCYCPPENGNNR